MHLFDNLCLSVQTRGYVFHTLSYNPIIFYLLYCSNCYRFGHWEIFQFGSVSFLKNTTVCVHLYMCMRMHTRACVCVLKNFLTWRHYKVLKIHSFCIFSITEMTDLKKKKKQMDLENLFSFVFFCSCTVISIGVNCKLSTHKKKGGHRCITKCNSEKQRLKWDSILLQGWEYLAFSFMFTATYPLTLAFTNTTCSLIFSSFSWSSCYTLWIAFCYLSQYCKWFWKKSRFQVQNKIFIREVENLKENYKIWSDCYSENSFALNN